MFSTLTATRQNWPWAFFVRNSLSPTFAMPHLTPLTVKANLPSLTLLPKSDAGAAGFGAGLAVVAAGLGAEGSCVALTTGAAALTAGGVADAEGGEVSPAAAVASGLLSLKLPIIIIRAMNPPMPVRILWRMNQLRLRAGAAAAPGGGGIWAALGAVGSS